MHWFTRQSRAHSFSIGKTRSLARIYYVSGGLAGTSRYEPLRVQVRLCYDCSSNNIYGVGKYRAFSYCKWSRERYRIISQNPILFTSIDTVSVASSAGFNMGLSLRLDVVLQKMYVLLNLFAGTSQNGTNFC